VVLRPLAVAPFFALALLTECNLRPKEGESCSTLKGRCLSKQDALYCVGLDTHAGTYQKLRCLGPKGCTEAGGRIGCDTTITDLGAVCPEALQATAACAGDGKSMLVCNARKWETQNKCLGAKGCSVSGDTVHCDESVSAAGDTCAHDGGMACTADGKTRLVCKDKKMVASSTCDGPEGCHVRGDDVGCDGLGDLAGAPCEPEGAVGCAADKKTRLVCTNGSLGSPVVCHGAAGCTRKDDKVYCDRSIATEGEPCIGHGNACSTDGKKVLLCKEGTFAEAWGCHTPCKVIGATGPGSEFHVACR
jgi:hypothetical protein